MHTRRRALALPIVRFAPIALATLIALLAVALLQPAETDAEDGPYHDCAPERHSGTSDTSGAGALAVGMDVDDLTDASNIVITGVVESLQSCKSKGPVGIVTLVTLAPDGALEAEAFHGGPMTVEVAGGSHNGFRLAVGMSPEFTVGERALFFLAVDEGTLYPAAGFQSKFGIASDDIVEGPNVSLSEMRSAVSAASEGELSQTSDPMSGGPEFIESSYTSIGPWFQDDQHPVAININPTTNKPAHITTQQARLAIINSYHTWQNLPHSYVSFGPVSDTARVSTQGDCDGLFDVTWGLAAAHSSGTLAVTYTCYFGSRILDADVEIDTDHFGNSWRVDGSGACGFGVFDLETVMLHENGHFLGLGHPSSNGGCASSCPVMDASYGGVQRTPCADDEAGANGIYPLAAGSPPAAPVLLVALPGDDVGLTWTDVANEWGYEIWRAQGTCLAPGTFVLLDTVADGVLAYSDDDYNNALAPGSTWCYKVRSFNKSGTGNFSIAAQGIAGGGDTPSPTLSPTPSPTLSPSPTPTPSPTTSPSPTASPTPSPTPTPTPTSSPTPVPTQTPATDPPTAVVTVSAPPTPAETPIVTPGTPAASPPPAPTNPPSPTATPVVKGDVDCDGQLTIKDALDILRSAGEVQPQGGCDFNGDVDCSGDLGAHDALLVLRKVVGFAIGLC
jgi:hypothetical protein